MNSSISCAYKGCSEKSAVFTSINKHCFPVGLLFCLLNLILPLIGCANWRRQVSLTRRQVRIFPFLFPHVSLLIYGSWQSFFPSKIYGADKFPCIQAVLNPQKDSRFGRDHVFSVVVFKKAGGTEKSNSSHQTRQATGGLGTRKSILAGRTLLV